MTPTQNSITVRKSTGSIAAAVSRRRLKAAQDGVLIGGGIMAGIGWAGLYFLVEGPPPLSFARWLFFILLYIAVTGTAIPFSWFLNRRFTRNNIVTGGIILRQGMWFGLFAVTAAWLRIPRALDGATAFFLALSMIVIETFLRIRERSQS